MTDNFYILITKEEFEIKNYDRCHWRLKFSKNSMCLFLVKNNLRLQIKLIEYVNM